ncbi:hypothetical protein [Carnobacterium maltaromaticum]|uniref:hypothetical protein n=1 Tax=Carnobacterium maltaromaticum TaxID=2751 RepID=UPI00295EE91D|nr:hypothetical protein [Carnobacterium maltaromaticum]
MITEPGKKGGKIMNMKKQIINWGFPPNWNEKNYQYKFSEEHTNDYGALFEIVDEKNNPIFEMDIVSTDEYSVRDSDCNVLQNITLNKIIIFNPNDRRKGFAKFYLCKLKEFCEFNEIKELEILPAEELEDIDLNNSIQPKKKLIDYYKKYLKSNSYELKFRNCE